MGWVSCTYVKSREEGMLYGVQITWRLSRVQTALSIVHTSEPQANQTVRARRTVN